VKSGVWKWKVNRRHPVIGNVIRIGCCMFKLLANFRFSIKALFAMVAIAAGCLAVFIAFVESNRRDWAREQERMFDDQVVRWNERSYIPNLAIEHTPTLPEWVIERLPLVNRDIFYRVTTLDIEPGTAHPEDFERCTEFSHVNTIRLGEFHETERLVAAFKQFPRLKTVHLMWTELDSEGISIVDAMAAELPGVEVINKNR